ncbi:uncharacterized protein LOC132611271 [Lycium barbarum]|uniref:uncharacterized protein LOC132611271 n=1 Tax=Lycium barbarum TaxID=112863 RepID=UPI00293E0468|nr:uncharacterized protein LOC132611271 [Lycium barbarum]
MKAVATKLSSWSREVYGDIFKDVKEAQKNINELERKYIEDNNEENRSVVNKARDEHTKFYQECKGSYRILDQIPQLITDDITRMLTAKPTKHEVRIAVKTIDPDSAPGPNVFGAKFYQVCIDLIKPELHNAIIEVFEGAHIPSKIIAKIRSNRISQVLPRIISPNQSVFIQGRSITDNILLAQELNYEETGFNGIRNGFFKSNRGHRQGDHLSPVMFVIIAELLSIMLNNLSLDENYSGYYSPTRGPSITHLAFEDDVILFPSGQLINKHKSCVAQPHRAQTQSGSTNWNAHTGLANKVPWLPFIC